MYTPFWIGFNEQYGPYEYFGYWTLAKQFKITTLNVPTFSCLIKIKEKWNKGGSVRTSTREEGDKGDGLWKHDLPF